MASNHGDYLLSESTEGWVLYDDEGRTTLLCSDLNAVLLDAAKVMRENSDPVRGGWIAVPNHRSADTAFSPKVGRELLQAQEIHPIVRARLRRLFKRVQDTYSERRHHR